MDFSPHHLWHFSSALPLSVLNSCLNVPTRLSHEKSDVASVAMSQILRYQPLSQVMSQVSQVESEHLP